ncbi:acyltransferase [Burkholderiaceae bacterium DAT-1]|nr:acyltransferase [Burkholderiaceae bacterium DAT-1]
MQTHQRIAGTDYLRALLAILVILHHAGQPYGPTGGSWPIHHAVQWHWLGPFFHINASFFMGLFFLISGYFTPGAVDSKGTRQWLADRFKRFVPAILGFGLLVVPLLRHTLINKAWADSFLPFEWGHLWFLGHLLIYAVLFVLIRSCLPRFAQSERPFPPLKSIIAYVAILSIASALTRQYFPIDRWVNIGVPAEIAHLPQYASLYWIGVLAAAGKWLNRVPTRLGTGALGMAGLLITWRLGLHLIQPSWDSVPGWMEHLIWNTWEAALCASLCLGLCWLFNRPNIHQQHTAQAIGQASFFIYVTHLPILVVYQFLFEQSSFGPVALTLITGMCTLTTCLLLSHLQKEMKRIFFR